MRAGFSLVEVALALLVVAVGLMGVFSLFPVGIESNRKAIQETQISLFAEYVLNGFRYESEQLAWAEVSDGPGFSISELASKYVWQSPPMIVAGPGVKVASYRALGNPDIEEMAFRYELRVYPVAGANDVKAMVLNIWPGQYGPLINTNTFYTEIYNYRGF
jgi:prepilin-type N-terminal cleavage/methylation domain-containing protein